MASFMTMLSVSVPILLYLTLCFAQSLKNIYADFKTMTFAFIVGSTVFFLFKLLVNFALNPFNSILIVY